MTRIVIKVWGGLVSEVNSTDKDTEVTVIDEDAPEEQELSESIDLPEYQVY